MEQEETQLSTPIENTDFEQLISELETKYPNAKELLKKRFKSVAKELKSNELAKNAETKMTYQEIKDSVYSVLDNDSSITSYVKLLRELKKGTRPVGASEQIRQAFKEYKVEKLKNRPTVPPKITQCVNTALIDTSTEIQKNIQLEMKQTFDDFKKEILETLHKNSEISVQPTTIQPPPQRKVQTLFPVARRKR